jgi:hypothetical protein
MINILTQRWPNHHPNFLRGIAAAVALLFFVSVITTHAAENTNRVSAIRVPGALKVVKAQLGADGTIHVLANADSGPQYLKTADGGRTFSTPIAVMDAAAQKPGLKFEGVDLAVAGDGRVHIAMWNNAWQLKLPQEEWGYFYASLAPGAKVFSPMRNLNHKPSEGFSLAAGERGAVTACFLSDKLYAMVSHDSGGTFSDFAEPNPAWDPCNCCTTSAAYGKDGRLALLYREKTNNDRDIYLALLDQARGSKPTRTRISGKPWKIEGCPMTYYSIAPTTMGYVAAWPTKGEVYFARLDKDGRVLPPGEIKTPGRNGMRTGMLAFTATDGATLVAWKNNDELGWQLYDAQGKPQGSPGSAPSPGGGAAGVVLTGGKFILFL